MCELLGETLNVRNRTLGWDARTGRSRWIADELILCVLTRRQYDRTASLVSCVLSVLAP